MFFLPQVVESLFGIAESAGPAPGRQMQQHTQQQQQQQQQYTQQNTSVYVALYDYNAADEDEVSFRKGKVPPSLPPSLLLTPPPPPQVTRQWTRPTWTRAGWRGQSSGQDNTECSHTTTSSSAESALQTPSHTYWTHPLDAHHYYCVMKLFLMKFLLFFEEGTQPESQEDGWLF